MTEETSFPEMAAQSLRSTRRLVQVSRNLHGHRRENTLYHRLVFLSLRLNVSQTDTLQGRQCTYEARPRSVRVTIVAVGGKNTHYIFWVCVCSRSYPACKAHVPCGLSGSTILFHII